MKLLTVLLLVLVAVPLTFAKTPLVAVPVPAPKPPGLLPQLIVTDGDKTMPLALAKVEVNTVIDGAVAQTTEILTFRNDAPRVLEGNLDFPLPEGAAVCGFGLDVDGVLVDGVPVPKDEARVTFEKEERKGVDPGLLEKTAGNSFRTRVYPIRPNSTRTVKVQYVSPIAPSPVMANEGGGDINVPAYRLPLRWSEAVGEFKLHVEVLNVAAAPELRGAGAGLKFESKDGRFVAEDSKLNVTFDSDLLIVMPPPAAHQALVERRTQTNSTLEQLLATMDKPEQAGQLAAPEYYFALQDQCPPSNFVNDGPAPVSERIGVYWDAGLTRDGTDKTREIEAIQAVLQAGKPNHVDLIVFSNTPSPAQHFDVKDGKCDVLIDAIKNITYDGGTDLSKLDLPAAIDNNKYDFHLLFTDGLASIGQPMPASMKAPVYVMTAAARANWSVLRKIAAESGGQSFNLLNLTAGQLGAAVTSHNPLKLLSVECKPDEIADIYPRGPQLAAGSLTIAGRLIANTATLKLNYGVGNTVTDSVSYTISRDSASDTGIVPRLWAQLKLAELETDAGQNGPAIADLGRQFNLVTSNTSLLVLETLQQYLTYKIVPPTSRAKIFADFVNQVRNTTAAAQKTKEQRLTEVLKEWNARVSWWEKEYKYEKGFKYVEQPANQPMAPGGVILMNGGNSAFLAATQPATVAGTDGHAERPSPVPLELRTPPQPRRANGSDDGVGPGTGYGGGVAAGGVGGVDQPETQVFARRVDATGIRALGKDGEILSGASITLAPWNPQTPYLDAIAKAGDGAYAEYLNQRKDHGSAPSFFLDCADYFLSHKQPDIAVRILTDIPALRLDNPELLRIAAHRFTQIGQNDLAIDLFEKVLRMRPEERQSYRDLGLALAGRAGEEMKTAAAMQSSDETAAHAALRKQVLADYQRALDLLNEVVIRPADQYPGIEVIALEDSNRILAEMGDLAKQVKNPIDPKFQKLLDCDLRVVMSWDTNNTDIDLWVTEPSGEKCFYQHNRTTIGGMLSNDITTGYGPEEYQVRKAMPGKYLIQANFFGSQAQALTGPTTVHCTVITHWGRPDEKRQELTVRLVNTKDVVDMGTVTME